NLHIKLEKASTHSILYFLEGKLDPLIADLTGELTASVNSNKLSISGITPLQLEDFRVQLGEGEPLLSHRGLAVNDLSIDLWFESFKLNLDGFLAAEETLAKLNAVIKSDG